ncbi:hypothetical protein EELLY_v1c04050 [Entomoplasma ellychniae]|uniref:Uncharacterized protein n=1 Tax=Entomoplasma ellychniae TaxID=2114 RepID=A0A8E2UAT2_9MOLU|nr:hypothetical protein EELLY_v1c04050 [Entomoplasma ellychniae]
MTKKSINSWNVKISRTLIDNDNCTEGSIRFFVRSKDKEN